MRSCKQIVSSLFGKRIEGSGRSAFAESFGGITARTKCGVRAELHLVHARPAKFSNSTARVAVRKRAPSRTPKTLREPQSVRTWSKAAAVLRTPRRSEQIALLQRPTDLGEEALEIPTGRKVAGGSR